MCLEQSKGVIQSSIATKRQGGDHNLMICARINTHIIDNANIKGRVVFPTSFLLLFRLSGVVVKYKVLGFWDQASIE